MKFISSIRLGRILLILLVFSPFLLFSNIVEAQSYNSSLINITLESPKFGVSRVDTFDIKIHVSNYSTQCKYTFNPDRTFAEIQTPTNYFTGSNGYDFTKTNFQLDLADNEEITIYFLCRTSSGYVNDGFPAAYQLSVDRTDPSILDAYADPQDVIENLQVDLVAHTDDKSICSFDPIILDEQEFYKFFNNSKREDFSTYNSRTVVTPAIQDNREYTYYAICMNRAQTFTQISTIKFRTNLSVGNELTELYPLGYVKTTNMDVGVTTNRHATCQYGTGYFNTFPQGSSTTHYIQETGLGDGVHKYPVKCFFDQGSPTILEDEIEFLIDLTPPGPVTIQATNDSCKNTSLSIAFNGTDNLEMSHFNYRIVDNQNVVLRNYTQTTNTRINLTGLDLIRGRTYYWEIYGTDAAGNNGTIVRSPGTKILSTTDDLCRNNEPPEINISTQKTTTGTSVRLYCLDDYDECKDIYYYTVNASKTCGSCTTCSYSKYYSLSPLKIDENTRVCYNITDGSHTVTDSVVAEYQACLNTGDGCCIKTTDGVCDPDCDEGLDQDCDPLLLDSDQDGMPDYWENDNGLDPHDKTDAALDKDNDGLTNLEEFKIGTDPTKADTDGDGYTDSYEEDNGSNPLDETSYPPNGDMDGDGIPESEEKTCGLDRTKPDAQLDNDGDGLTNEQECNIGTYVNRPDSDGDGYTDYEEYQKGTDPLDESIYPKSYVLNIIAFILGAGALIGGAIVLLKNTDLSKLSTPKPKGIMPDASKKIVNFKDSRNDLKKESDRMIKKGKGMPASLAHIPYRRVALPVNVKNSKLDDQLRRKREDLRIKQMSTVFDQFAEDEKVKLEKAGSAAMDKIIELKEQDDESAFNRLDDLSDEDAFEELEVLSKKEKKGKKK